MNILKAEHFYTSGYETRIELNVICIALLTIDSNIHCLTQCCFTEITVFIYNRNEQARGNSGMEKLPERT